MRGSLPKVRRPLSPNSRRYCLFLSFNSWVFILYLYLCCSWFNCRLVLPVVELYWLAVHWYTVVCKGMFRLLRLSLVSSTGQSILLHASSTLDLLIHGMTRLNPTAHDFNPLVVHWVRRIQSISTSAGLLANPNNYKYIIIKIKWWLIRTNTVE